VQSQSPFVCSALVPGIRVCNRQQHHQQDQSALPQQPARPVADSRFRLRFAGQYSGDGVPRSGAPKRAGKLRIALVTVSSRSSVELHTAHVRTCAATLSLS
jgi:hypothetical protein